MPPRRARILVTNDDGIDAPGLTTLVRALSAAAAAAASAASDDDDGGGDGRPLRSRRGRPSVDIFVAAPEGERSAQSHAITLDREMSAEVRSVEGAAAAFAVRGTPADSCMLALNSPLFFGDGDGDEAEEDASKEQQQHHHQKEAHFYPGEAGPGEVQPLSRGAEAAPSSRFALVVSGINRGDNCGLHVIYSGTVGAAREGACKGVPALAFSLDDHGARSAQAYASAARAAAAVVMATLGVLEEGEEEEEEEQEDEDSGDQEQQRLRPASAAAAAWALRQGLVLNVNFPRAMSSAPPPQEEEEGEGVAGCLRGLALCHQGTGCIFPAYREVVGEAKEGNGAAADGNGVRLFRCYAGGARRDDADWCDTWAVRLGWASVTPLSLRQDLRLPPGLVPRPVGGKGDGEGGGEARDGEAMETLAERGLAAASEVVRRAAAALGVEAGGRLLPELRGGQRR
jgi:5'-nucleotidase